MALGPPGFIRGVRMYQRVMRTVLPRAQGRLAARHDHHVARGRTGRTALGGHQVIPPVPLEELRGFQPHAFRLPFPWIGPPVIDLLRLPGRRETVGRQRRDETVVRIQVPAAGPRHHMARVDAADVQLHRLAPRAFGPIGINHIVLAGTRGIVDVIFTAHLAQVRGENGVIAVFHRPCDGLPVDEVRGMPDEQGREIRERRMRHVEIGPVPQDRGIRVIARKDTGLEGFMLRRTSGKDRGEQQEEYALFHIRLEGCSPASYEFFPVIQSGWPESVFA